MKKPEDFVEEVEAIKLALGTVQYSGISIKVSFELCLRKYLELFEHTGDSRYLRNALLHMQAFLEMGFVYEEFADLFDRILSEIGFDKEEVFPKRFYSVAKVKLVKGEVRKMIPRWSASKYHTLPINEVVNDIIEKVTKKREGHYYYHSNQNPQKKDDDIYELVITNEECFFYDISRKKYYMFVE